MKLAKILAPAAFLALFAGCQGSVTDVDDNDDPPPVNPDPDPDPVPVGDGRVSDGLVALFNFDEGSGSIVADATGSGYNLTIADPEAVTWLPGGGLSIDTPTIITNEAAATHIISPCMVSNEITIELWGRTNQIQILDAESPARIVTLSGNANNRNFHLAQDTNGNIGYANARLRTTISGNNGADPETQDPNESTFDGSIHHVVYTRSDTSAEGLIWMDGNIIATQPLGGDFSTWDTSYSLALGNEVNYLDQPRPWRGEYYKVAVYCKALNATEVNQNYEAGW
jgi:hypothetical protein